MRGVIGRSGRAVAAVAVGLALAAAGAVVARSAGGAAGGYEFDHGHALGEFCAESGTLSLALPGAGLPAGTGRVYVNVWVDWNTDGDWLDLAEGDVCAPEWVVQNVPIDLPAGFAGSEFAYLADVMFVTGSELRKARYRVTVSDTPMPDAGGMPGPFEGEIAGSDDGEAEKGEPPAASKKKKKKAPPPLKRKKRVRLLDAGCYPSTLVLDHGEQKTIKFWTRTAGKLPNGRYPAVYVRLRNGVPAGVRASFGLGKQVQSGFRVLRGLTISSTIDGPTRRQQFTLLFDFSLGGSWNAGGFTSRTKACKVVIHHQDVPPFELPPLPPRIPCGGIDPCGGVPPESPTPLPAPGPDLGSWLRQMFEGREVVAINVRSSAPPGLSKVVESVVIPLGHYRDGSLDGQLEPFFANPYALSGEQALQFPTGRVPQAATTCELISEGGRAVLDCLVSPQPAGSPLGIQLVLDARGFEALVADACPAPLAVGLRLADTPRGQVDYAASIPRFGCP